MGIHVLYFDIKWRLLYLAIGAGAFVLAFSIGAATDISKSETENLRQHFNEQLKDINQNKIFMNNLRVSLGMFVPGLGIGLGTFSGFSTGLTFKVILQSTPLLNNVSPIVILVTPYGVMEVFAYALAMSRSGMLIYDFVKKRQWKEYVIPTIIEIGFVIAILLIGATIEWYFIEQFGVNDRLKYFLVWSL